MRATTDPGDLDPPSHLNPPDPVSVDQDGRAWLAKVWTRPEVREALSLASPGLGRRLDHLLTDQAGAGSAKDLRRAVLSVASYLLRWQRRATPFGLFAGVTTAAIGAARAEVGAAHRPIVRADAEWVATLVHRLEGQRLLRERLAVVADNTRVVRDGRVIVHPRAQIGAATPGPLRESSVRLTRPIAFAVDAAASPIRFHTLTDRLAAQFPAASTRAIHNLVHGLIDAGLLITSLRAAMTTTDALPCLIAALRAADPDTQEHLPAHPSVDPMVDIAALLGELDDLRVLLAVHNSAISGTGQGIDSRIDRDRFAADRAALAERMTALAPVPGPVVAADVRLDATIAVPEPVITEAALAADVLLRTGTQPFGTAAWLDYHARFRDRYGTSALVGVRDLIADSGLGYPAGYLGTTKARPAWRTLTDRDAALLALIQHTTLTGAGEIELTDTDIAALTVGDHATAVLPDRMEVGVVVCAASAAAIDSGDFRLRITATPRTPTSMAGRFAHLLDPADRAQLAATYTVPTNEPGGPDSTVAVQLSFPPRRPHNENVVRVPPLLPTVLSLAEHPDPAHPDLDLVDVDDLAVTADADQMYLVRRSTGQRVIPRIPHALDTRAQTPPLARFLAEIADARTTVFRGFDFGAARVLPYVPRIRYRRTVLAAARWLLNGTDLDTKTTTSAQATAVDGALTAWRRRWRVPARVVLVDGELRLPLNLDHDLDRALLRQHLDRADRAELHEDDPADAQGWIGRPAELLIPLAPITPPARPLPVTGPAGTLLRPGDSPVLHAQLAGNPARFDDILTNHLPRLLDRLCGVPASRPDTELKTGRENGQDSVVAWWWARRHRDLIHPETDQHLAVFLRLTGAEHYGPVATRMAGFAAELQALGLPCQLTLAPAPRHPARYGDGPAGTAAEQVFATDTRAAIAQLATARDAQIPAPALAGVSMAHLAAAFAPDPHTGHRALLDLLPREHGPLDRTLRDDALALADDHHAVRALPGGTALAAAWRARDTALRAYHQALAAQGHEPGRVLRTLLHEHHVRAVGVDPTFEKQTGRLARAVALRLLALAGGR